jgi:hypothetical protein
MSAIKMVAFGVLDSTTNEVARLVKDECEARGWLLSSWFKTRGGPERLYELHGPLAIHGAAWKTRVRIGTGTLEVLCKLALEYDERFPNEAG